MNESTHTPGPWKYDTEGCIAATFNDADAALIAVCTMHVVVRREDQRMQANARLIAAAPDLLEELEALTGELERMGFHDMPGDTNADLRNRYDSAMIAIAKTRPTADDLAPSMRMPSRRYPR